MQAITPKDQALTVKNILLACKDINKLNKRGYNFLYLANGFIAHYNLAGFIDHYSDNDLITDILNNASFNQWRNFSPSDKDYYYYMSKRAIYNEIMKGLTNE
jgi:hypothetical protein